MTIRILILVVSVGLVCGNPTQSNQEPELNEDQFNPFEKCSLKEGFTGMINCAASRTLKMLQLAGKVQSIEIYPGIALISEQPQLDREGKASNEDLPSNPNERTQKLLNLIVDAASRFISGRTLKFKIPQITADGLANALEEGRGKMKKGGFGMSPLLLGIGAKVLIVKGLLLAGLLLMSIKALVLSKIAFVLAAIVGIPSLFAGGFNFKNNGGLGGHGNGWNTGGSYGPPYGTTNSIGGWGNSQYPYARSIDNVEDESKVDAQDLAYSGQKS